MTNTHPLYVNPAYVPDDDDRDDWIRDLAHDACDYIDMVYTYCYGEPGAPWAACN